MNEITEAIIGAAIEVHRSLGPGLLESAYRQCLCHELQLRGLAFVCERPLPVIYTGLRLEWVPRGLDCCRSDRSRAQDRRSPGAGSATLTYLRLGGWKLGL